MIVKTLHTVNLDIIKRVITTPFDNGKHSLTEPTGDFFYDPWKIKEEYKNTLWEQILNSLKEPWGEARIIILESPSCYTCHADIDDRYHLNIAGDEGYLIDLETQQMYKLKQDGVWYEMDAGKLHTAISVGEHTRVQLVVRKLLTRSILNTPVKVHICTDGENPRYSFDNKISSWLNRANKRNIITNFKHSGASVRFDIEHDEIALLKEIIPKEFKYEFE
jgi:hypothetical protein